MSSLTLSDKSAAQLSNLLTQYVLTLRTIVDALGLEGEWQFDPLTQSLVSKEVEDADRTS